MCLEQWGEFKYYIVIFDQLQSHSGGLIWALESCVRGPLTPSSNTTDRDPMELDKPNC